MFELNAVVFIGADETQNTTHFIYISLFIYIHWQHIRQEINEIHVLSECYSVQARHHTRQIMMGVVYVHTHI